MKWQVLVVAVVALLLASACDADPADVGMSLKSETGQLLIYGTLCKEDEKIVGVRLVHVENFDSKDGETLWQISSTSGSRDLVFTVGEEPPEFELVQPLLPLPAGDPFLRAEIEIATGENGNFKLREAYRLSALRPGLVRAHGDLIAADEWGTYVRETYCEPPAGIFGR